MGRGLGPPTLPSWPVADCAPRHTHPACSPSPLTWSSAVPSTDVFGHHCGPSLMHGRRDQRWHRLKAWCLRASLWTVGSRVHLDLQPPPPSPVGSWMPFRISNSAQPQMTFSLGSQTCPSSGSPNSGSGATFAPGPKMQAGTGTCKCLLPSPPTNQVPSLINSHS